MPSTRAWAVVAVGLEMKPVGKPDAGNPHVRFDERGRETGQCATAPVLDSTDQWPQTASAGRYHRADGGRPRASRRHPDRDGAPLLLATMRSAFPWLRHVFADAGYAGEKLRQALAKLGQWTLDIVRRSEVGRRFRTTATALGGGAHHRLAQSKPAPRKGLRSNDRKRKGLALHRQRQAALAPHRQAVSRSHRIMS